MKITTIVLSTFLAAAVLAAPLAEAGPGKRGEKANAPAGQREGLKAPRGERAFRPGKGPGFGAPGMEAELPRFWTRGNVAERLALTPEQIAQLEATADTTEQALEAVRPELEAAHAALRAEMEKDSPDLATAQKLGETVHRLRGERHRILLGHRVAVKNILTQEQEDEVREAMQDWRQRRGGWWRGHDGGGPGAARPWLHGIESREELEALLEERGIDGPKRERALRAWSRLQERDSEGAGSPEAPMPPLPPRR